MAVEVGSVNGEASNVAGGKTSRSIIDMVY